MRILPMRSSELYNYSVTIKKGRGRGSYKVHRSDCTYLAMASVTEQLDGKFIDCQSALKEAKKGFRYVEACWFCP